MNSTIDTWLNWPWLRFILSPKIRSARLWVSIIVFGLGIRRILFPQLMTLFEIAPSEVWGILMIVFGLATLITTFYKRWDWYGRISAVLLTATLATYAVESWDASTGNTYVLICMTIAILLEAIGDAYVVISK